ncbi:MAG: hypothetical protein WBZ51_30100, partial [Xanthobacteraceae bacterium]
SSPDAVRTRTPRRIRANAKLLRNQLAGEPGGILDNNGAHAIALDPIQQRSEPRTRFDGDQHPNAGSENSSTRTNPDRLANASIAAR